MKLNGNGNGNGYELREPEKPANGKPLYRLHELASRPDDVVILTEREYKADQLAALGLLVTTSGAADAAGEADWQAPRSDDAVGANFGLGQGGLLMCPMADIYLHAFRLPGFQEMRPAMAPA